MTWGKSGVCGARTAGKGGGADRGYVRRVGRCGGGDVLSSPNKGDAVAPRRANV